MRKKPSEISINENFFDNPETWTPKQAYWFGWMYTDGHNDIKRNNFYLRLQEKDIKIIQKFKDDLEYTGTLTIEKRKPMSIMGGPIKQYQNRALIRPTNKKISQQLALLGIIPNKAANSEFPAFLRDDLIPHFLRGAFEGNGTFSFPETWNKFECNFIANPSFLETLDKHIQKVIPITRRAKLILGNGCRAFRMAGNDNAILLLNYLYRDNAGYFLERKFEVYKKLVEFKKSLSQVDEYLIPHLKEAEEIIFKTLNK